MKITIDIKDDIYKEIEMAAKNDNTTVDAEFEKAVLLQTPKKALIRRLMDETCDEFDVAMKKLAR
jgi:hypothetical protein